MDNSPDLNEGEDSWEIAEWHKRKPKYYKEIEKIERVHDGITVAVKETTSYRLNVEVQSNVCNWVEGMGGTLLSKLCRWGVACTTTGILTTGCGSLITLGILIDDISKHKSLDADAKVSAGFFGTCFVSMIPWCAAGLLLKLKARRIEKESKKYLNAVRDFYTEIFPSIKKQEVQRVIEILSSYQKLPLDAVTDRDGNTPLLAAIKYANAKKDPDFKIIKELIARGASLWYGKKSMRRDLKTPKQLEEGAPLLNDNPLENPRPHHQPFLQLLNRKDLHTKIVKPLCDKAEKDLRSRNITKLTTNEKAVAELIMR